MLKVRPELAKLTLQNGHTALHYAVFSRSPEIVRLLLEHGADPNKGIWPHSDATTPFILSKERGYEDIVQVILDQERRRSATELAHDPHAWPAELIAIASARDESGIIAFLEKHPEYINVPYYMMAPLHLAAARPLPHLLNWLLDHGADPDLRDRNGPSPLELIRPNLDPQLARQLVAILISRGAKMTARVALTHGHADWIRARHAEGKLETTLPTPQGYAGLLEAAVYLRRKNMLDLLLDLGLDPDQPLWDPEANEQRRSRPLALCAETGQVEMAEALLARGATLTAPAAVWLGKSEWLRKMHAAGKLDNPLTSEGGLLTMAIKHRRREIIELLLDLGLDPDERHRVDAYEMAYSWGAPLRACVKQGDLELARLLLDRGADPNGQDGYYASAVYTAYCERNQPMIDLLESRGGYLSAAEAGYACQTEIARKMIAGEMEPHLEVAPYSGKTTLQQLLHSASTSGTLDIVRMVLERIDWRREDQSWYGILWNTLPGHQRWPEDARDRYLACFRLILDRCDPNLHAAEGQTILHEVIARDFGDGVTLARMLLDAGARTDIRDNLLESTPLGWACRWGRLGIAKLLLEQGADPVEPDSEPWATPRAWAEKSRNNQMLALLRDHQDRVTREQNE